MILDDSELDRLFSNACMLCRHYDPEVTARACDAFPDGIPDAIWSGKNDHAAPYPGDNGIIFEAIE